MLCRDGSLAEHVAAGKSEYAGPYDAVLQVVHTLDEQVGNEDFGRFATAIVLIASGVNEAAVAAMVTSGWKVVHYCLAVLFLLAGLWAFIRPIDTFFALASVLGLILVFYGASEIARGVASRGETPYWWADLVSGVLLLLLAAWVSTSDPQAVMARRTYLILFWVGFMALLRGFTQIMLAFSLRQLGTEAARREPAVTGSDDAPPVIPAQERRGVNQAESAQQTVRTP